MGLSAHIEMVPWKELLQTSPFMARGAVCFLNPARRSSTKAPSLCGMAKKTAPKNRLGGTKKMFFLGGWWNKPWTFLYQLPWLLRCWLWWIYWIGWIKLWICKPNTHIPFFEAPQIDLKIRIPRVVKSPFFIQVLSLISATFLGATLTLFHLVSHDFLVSWVSSIGDFSKTTISR